MNRAYQLFFFCISLISTPVLAADTVPVQLQQALEYALENRLEMTQARLAVSVAKAGVKEEQGLRLPTLDVTANLYRQESTDDFSGIEVNGAANGVPVSVQVERVLPQYQSAAGLEAKWNVYAGGKHQARIAHAKADVEKAQAELRKTRRQVASEVASALIRWRQAQVEKEVADKRRELAHKSMQITRLQHGGGAESDFELQRKNLEMERAEIGLQKAERKTRKQWSDYLNALNYPQMAAQGRADQDLGLGETMLDQWLPDSVDPALKVAQSEVEKSRYKLEERKAAFRPEVNLLLRYNTVERSDQDLFDALPNFSSSDFQIGVEMRLNLYSGRSDRYRSRQAAIRHEQAINEVLLVKKSRREMQRKLTENLQAAGDDLRMARQELKLQQFMKRIKDRELENGDLSQLAYMQAEMDLAEARETLRLQELELALAQIRYWLENSGE